MGFKDASGRVEIVTDIDTFDCMRLQPRNPAERAKEADLGPLYRIIASFSKHPDVEAKISELNHTHKDGKYRLEVIHSKREIDALARGEFRVRVDGEWADDYGRA